MISLIEKTNDVINSEVDYFTYYYFYQDWREQLQYYGNDIIAAVENYHEDKYSQDWHYYLMEWLYDNYQLCLDYQNASFPYCPKNHFAIGSPGEMSFQCPDWMKKPSVKKMINQHTDLYIDNHNIGYYLLDYDYVYIDLDKIDYSAIDKLLAEYMS